MNQPSKNFAAIGFGEVMMRLSPPGSERMAQSHSLLRHAGGAELNVMSGIARLGLRTGIISKLPDNMVGSYIRNQLRSYGVSDDHVIQDMGGEARLGIYYYESGVFPRKPAVSYDRQRSSFTTFSMEEINKGIFDEATLFHTSGISLALGDQPQNVATQLMRGFRQAGAMISFDVNYRANLWGEKEARDVIESILPYVDILFVSEESSRRMFGRSGTMEEIMRGYCHDYQIKVVASTQRTVNSPRSHTFGSILYAADEDVFYTEQPYKNIEVIDRIGSGDAYVAGVLAMLLAGQGYQKAVSCGNAMSAVKNTVSGDLIVTTLTEIEAIIADHYAVGQKNEMNR